MSRDQRTAQEMIDASGQTGVPVITVDGAVVVGFDRARLERLVPVLPRARPRLGASVRPTEGGLLVGIVHAGSPAARAGLRSGDVIRSIDGVPIRTPDELQDRLSRSDRPGGIVELRVERTGQRLLLRLTPPV